MPLVISDDILSHAELDEQNARIEFACYLFDAGRLSIVHAAELAGMDKDAFETELHARGFPRYRYTEEDFERDKRAVESFRNNKANP